MRGRPVARGLRLLIGWWTFAERAEGSVIAWSRSWRVLTGILLVIGTAAASVAWWATRPVQDVAETLRALERGDRPAIEHGIQPDSVLSAFFDEWARTTAFQADGTPRAITLSVKPEALQRLRQLYRDEFTAVGTPRGWLLDGVRFTPGRWAATGADHTRLVPVSLRLPGGERTRIGLVVRRIDDRWQVVAIQNAVPAMDALLRTHPRENELTPAAAARAAVRARGNAWRRAQTDPAGLEGR